MPELRRARGRRNRVDLRLGPPHRGVALPVPVGPHPEPVLRAALRSVGWSVGRGQGRNLSQRGPRHHLRLRIIRRVLRLVPGRSVDGVPRDRERPVRKRRTKARRRRWRVLGHVRHADGHRGRGYGAVPVVHLHRQRVARRRLVVQVSRNRDRPRSAVDRELAVFVARGDAVGKLVALVRVGRRHRAHRVAHGGILGDLELVGCLAELRRRVARVRLYRYRRGLGAPSGGIGHRIPVGPHREPVRRPARHSSRRRVGRRNRCSLRQSSPRHRLGIRTVRGVLHLVLGCARDRTPRDGECPVRQRGVQAAGRGHPAVLRTVGQSQPGKIIVPDSPQ